MPELYASFFKYKKASQSLTLKTGSKYITIFKVIFKAININIYV